MTYFFAEGHIYVILNKLAKLSTQDYNSEGTASMMIKTLFETLGFTKSKLSKVLKHFVYDGGRTGYLSEKFIIPMYNMITIFTLSFSFFAIYIPIQYSAFSYPTNTHYLGAV